MRDSPPGDRPLKFFLDLIGKVLVSDLGNNHIHKHNPGHDQYQVDDPFQRYTRTSGIYTYSGDADNSGRRLLFSIAQTETVLSPTW